MPPNNAVALKTLKIQTWPIGPVKFLLSIVAVLRSGILTNRLMPSPQMKMYSVITFHLPKNESHLKAIQTHFANFVFRHSSPPFKSRILVQN